MRHRFTVLLLGTFLAVVASSAAAQVPLSVTLETYLVTEVTLEDGTVEEQLVPTEVAQPGQVLEYHLVLENSGEAAISQGVAATGPVPASTHYLAETATRAEGSKLVFSADEGATFSATPTVTVTDEDGVEKEVKAEPEQYDAVRWELSTLAPGQTRTFVYRVEVL